MRTESGSPEAVENRNAHLSKVISKHQKLMSGYLISSEEKLLKPPKLNISQIVEIIASAAIDPTDVVAILQELLS